MRTFTRSLTFASPPKKVFALLADVEQAKQWMPAIQSVEMVTDGPMGLGSSWVETRKVGRRVMRSPIKVTEFVPDKVFAIAVDQKMAAMAFRFELAKAGKGTAVTFSAAVGGRGLGKLFERMIYREVEKSDSDILERLRRHIDG